MDEPPETPGAGIRARAGHLPAPGPGAPALATALDGTLVKTDLPVGSVVLLPKSRPLCALRMPAGLLRGKAHFKAEVAKRAIPDIAQLPYRRSLLEYLQAERAGGRRLILATAADGRVARLVADRLGLFDTILASDGRVNLSGERKRERLVAEPGEKAFDYAGNSRRDLPVWHSARRALLVGGAAGLRAPSRPRGWSASSTNAMAVRSLTCARCACTTG